MLPGIYDPDLYRGDTARCVTLAAALALVLLHRADGGAVTIAAAHVTSLRETPGSLNKLVPAQTKCLVGLTDGKFVAVLEPCGEVRKLLEAAARPSSG